MVRRRAALAVYPPRVAVAVMLFLPDGNAMFDLLNVVATGEEGFLAMVSAYADPDRELADGERADAVHARGVLHSEARHSRRHDALAFLDGERLECFVLEPRDFV